MRSMPPPILPVTVLVVVPPRRGVDSRGRAGAVSVEASFAVRDSMIWN